MKKRLVKFLSVGMLIFGLIGVTEAATYNLTDDWNVNSEHNNPNNQWQYNAGTTPLDWSDSFNGYISTGGSFWHPAFIQAQSSSGEFEVGDIMVHGTDPNSPIASGEANLTWTSLQNGTTNITGEVWFGDYNNRSMDWTLYVNDVQIDSGTVYYGDVFSREDPDTFSYSFDALIEDVVRLDLTKNVDSLYADFVGVDMTVSQVPVPGAAWLLGSGLIGLGIIKRKKKQL